MSWLNALRLKYFIATRSVGFSADYMERLYTIYLNHSKVIHWRRGFPVYSLTTPAAYSKPQANFMARQVYRGIQNRNLPNMMSFAINDVCNAFCKHCSFFGGVEDRKRTTLNHEESVSLIAQAQELGVSVINFVGGEPLLRADLPELISAVDKDLSTTVLFTNGLLLEEKLEQLRMTGLDGIFVSIEYADAAKHDEHRGRPGLFDKAIAGIKKAKSMGFSVGFSACITPESYRDGELGRIIELGKKVGVHEVLVFDALPTGRYTFREDLIDNPDWVENLIHEVSRYNRDASYPGVFAFPYAASHRSVGCSCGTSYFYASPYGDIMSCDFNHTGFGNLREKPLYKIWDHMTTLKEFSSAKWGGCKIKSSDARASGLVNASVVQESPLKEDDGCCGGGCGR